MHYLNSILIILSYLIHGGYEMPSFFTPCPFSSTEINFNTNNNTHNYTYKHTYTYIYVLYISYILIKTNILKKNTVHCM